MPELNTSTGRTLSGRCRCGQVCYEVADEFQYAANCHCSACRRATGSAFKPFGGIQRKKFAVCQGKDFLKIMGEPNAHDARCEKCGSLLYSIVRKGEYVHVTFGTLIGDPSLKPTEHIYVGSKASWFTITDQLPQHLELPGAD
jgi:hypothetical protein